MLKKFFATNAGFGVFWIRLPLGIAMMMHGYGKFTNMQGFIDFCDNIGIPPFFAVLGACGEFLGGLGVLLGCLSRIAAFGIACTMATAAVSRHLIPGYGYEMNWHGALPLGTEGYEYHTLAIGMGLAIMFLGAGSFSVDYYIARWLSHERQRSIVAEAIPVMTANLGS